LYPPLCCFPRLEIGGGCMTLMSGSPVSCIVSAVDQALGRQPSLKREKKAGGGDAFERSFFGAPV
jgi:hypothetical protein